jgi:hypothetical protein
MHQRRAGCSDFIFGAEHIRGAEVHQTIIILVQWQCFAAANHDERIQFTELAE